MTRPAILALTGTLILFGCGEKKKRAEDLDLIGNGNKRPSTQNVSDKKRKEIKGLKDVLAVDLLQDLVFRYERDRWTLTSHNAQVNEEKLKTSGLDLVLAGIPLSPPKSPVSVLDSGIETMERLAAETGGAVSVARSYAEAKRLAAQDRIAVMFLIEGADAFLGNPQSVAKYKERGLLAVGLTAGRGNGFADAAISPREHGGLTPKGAEFLSHCRDAKIAVDLTHASPSAFWDARAHQAGAVMVSHTACRALMDHPRNLDDLQIIALAQAGGLMGLMFNPVFLAPGGEASLETIVSHVMHVKALDAIEGLALGTDFDGIHPPRGLSHVGELDRLFDALIEQGLSVDDVKGIAGQNATRFFDELHREFGAVSHTEDEMLRPIPIECDSVTGESDGLLSSACDHFVVRGGVTLPPSSRQRVRLKDVVSIPGALEIFGEPDVPWQVEGQNLAGKILFHRFVQLDGRGRGTMTLPENRNLTRLFLSPTRKSELREAVVWGRPGPAS